MNKKELKLQLAGKEVIFRKTRHGTYAHKRLSLAVDKIWFGVGEMWIAYITGWPDGVEIEGIGRSPQVALNGLRKKAIKAAARLEQLIINPHARKRVARKTRKA